MQIITSVLGHELRGLLFFRNGVTQGFGVLVNLANEQVDLVSDKVPVEAILFLQVLPVEVGEGFSRSVQLLLNRLHVDLGVLLLQFVQILMNLFSIHFVDKSGLHLI